MRGSHNGKRKDTKDIIHKNMEGFIVLKSEVRLAPEDQCLQCQQKSQMQMNANINVMCNITMLIIKILMNRDHRRINLKIRQ